MKTLIGIGILLLALTGVAQAAEPVFSGPVGFNIVSHFPFWLKGYYAHYQILSLYPEKPEKPFRPHPP